MAYRSKRMSSGKRDWHARGVLVQALPEEQFTGEGTSTSVKALITFAWP